MKRFRWWFAFLALCVLRVSKGDLEPTFKHCCNLGTNRATEEFTCHDFPAPVIGVPPEQQSICLSAVEICCLKKHREQQCEIGKGAARSGTDCLVASTAGGEYRKDCCEACKLGLISGSMGMGCVFQNFAFGIPWDGAYRDCCLAAQPYTTSPAHVTSPTTLASSNDKKTTIIPTPALDSLCDLLPGELCAHICVPIPGSFRCLCHEGFTLMADGKSCQHDDLPNRCKLNNPCAHKCLDTGVAVECSCHPGYQLAVDEKSCNDIDECDLGIHTCEPDIQICRNEPGSYTCVNKDGSVSQPAKPEPGKPGTLSNFDAGKCPLGYQYNFQSQVCNDIDECLLKTADCGINSACQNTIGSFICVRKPVESCPPGYQFDDHLQICTDIDECSERLDNCQQEGLFCVNTIGNYTCESRTDSQCPAGYKFNKALSTCEDVDECMENLHGCVPDTETCRNTVGAYECDMKCDTGYQYSLAHRTCIDIDECKLQTHNCRTQCVNTIGSYNCVEELKAPCAAGYKPSSGDQECEDVDECAENIDSCAKIYEVCINEIGSYRCEPMSDVKEDAPTTPAPSIDENMVDNCEPGYSYSYDRRACLDVNECLTDLHNCSLNDGEECVNVPGSFMCRLSPACPKSYVYNKLTMKCEDEDECTLGTHTCSLSEQCVNNQGGYWCNPVCRAGFMFGGAGSCVDIDECQRKMDNCNTLTDRCVNTEGSFKCMSIVQCQAGFRLTSLQQCEDIDECSENTHNCNRDIHMCVNTPGSFSCVLKNQNCLPGFRFNGSILLCEDVDECAEGTHNCDPLTQYCYNTKGSYQCHSQQRSHSTSHCSSGLKLDPVTRTCVDINECEDNNMRCHIGERCVNTRGSYRCVKSPGTPSPLATALGQGLFPNKPNVSRQCPAGFKFNALHGRCFDVNECEERTHVCNLATEVCLNEPGGYRCGKRNITSTSLQCQNGFRYNEATKICVDINECDAGTNDCNLATEVCLNEPGSYRCVRKNNTGTTIPLQCQTGFKYSDVFKTCVDVDECIESVEPVCASSENCENNIGSFVCICKKGFQLDRTLLACVDVNECQVNKHNCLPSQRCDNTIGSFHCIRFTSCGTGYTLNAQTGQCEDDDECTLGTDNCRTLGPTWQCRNTYGSFRCERKRCDAKQVLMSNGECKPLECHPGYDASQHGQCIDINECERNNPCRRNQHCINTPGSYRCVNMLNCPVGYELNESGNRCLDIDECTKGTHDCKFGQQCINSAGGYICQCPQGHTLNHNKECVDIDECARFAGQICAINSECHNTVGSYRCICKDGFRQDPKGGNSCVDIDECTDSPGLCHQNCINIWGSYRCSCNQGFILQADNRTCQDIDECEQFKDRNLCVGICVNQPGSYSCQCPDGYRLGTNGHTCQDIDECIGGNVCRNPNEVCLNTRGSYRCNTIQCPPNFVKDPEHKKYYLRENSYMCKRDCRPQDTICRMNNTNTITYQFLSIPMVKMLPVPMVVTRIRAVTLGSTRAFKVHFEVLHGNEEQYFDFIQGTKLGELRLVRPVFGPKHFLVKIQMKVFTARNYLSAKHLAFVDIDVSNYEF